MSARYSFTVFCSGRDADADHLGAQFVQRLRRHLVSGPVGAIDDDAHARKAEAAGERRLGDLDVAGLAVVDPLHPSERRRRGQVLAQALVHQRLDRHLLLIGELVAVGSEQLDAVVGEGVVRGRDHHAQVGPQRAGHHRHARRGQRAELAHVHAHAGEAGDQGGLDHVAGQARVLADHHQVAALVAGHEHLAGGHADPQGDLRRHGMAVGLAADAVGAEIGALAHGSDSSKRSETQI
jgi:hypothetical protein